MEESISLEETNKIRISLGLKPLTDDKAPAGDKDKEAEDNWSKKREQERKDREAKWVSYAYFRGSTDMLLFLQEDPGRNCEVSIFSLHYVNGGFMNCLRGFQTRFPNFWRH